MKLLVITDSYPPFHTGGYELRCKDVMNRLKASGYDIRILSTKVDQNVGKELPLVKRLLNVDNYSLNLIIRIWKDYNDVNVLHKEIKAFDPDAIYIWHIINMSKAIMPYLSTVNKQIFFDEGGKGLYAAWSQRGAWYYFVEHHVSSKLFNLIKLSIISIISLLSENKLKREWAWPKGIIAYFNSNTSRQWTENKGIPIQKTFTIHSGINIDEFNFKKREKINNPIRIIVPGRISPTKSICDVIPLLDNLNKNNIKAKAILVGKIFDEDYYKRLVYQIEQHRLQHQIEIKSMVKHEEMVKIYHDSDICFFPSVQEVGLSRIPLEAMSCGTLVVTYGKEGSSELVENGVSGYVVNKMDFNEIIKILITLINQPKKYKEIINTAREKIEKNHTLDVYTNKIDNFLKKHVDGLTS